MQTPDVERPLETTLDAVNRRRKVRVSGSVGSGRRTLAGLVASRHPNTIEVELLESEEVDSGAAGLLIAVAGVRNEETRRSLVERARSPSSAALDTANALDREDRTLVVFVPSSWTFGRPDSGEDDARLGRGRALLEGLGATSRIVWIADHDVSPVDLGITVDEYVELPRFVVALTIDVETWGDYVTLAERLKGQLGDWRSSPLVWRLAVGVLGVDSDFVGVVSDCERPVSEALTRLARRLANALRRRPALRDAVLRFLQARRPLPRDVVLRIAGAPADAAPLFTHCIGYGEPVRVSGLIRSSLLRHLSPNPGKMEAAHLLRVEACVRIGAENGRTLDVVADPLVQRMAERGWKGHCLIEGLSRPGGVPRKLQYNLLTALAATCSPLAA